MIYLADDNPSVSSFIANGAENPPCSARPSINLGHIALHLGSVALLVIVLVLTTGCDDSSIEAVTAAATEGVLPAATLANATDSSVTPDVQPASLTSASERVNADVSSVRPPTEGTREVPVKPTVSGRLRDTVTEVADEGTSEVGTVASESGNGQTASETAIGENLINESESSTLPSNSSSGTALASDASQAAPIRDLFAPPIVPEPETPKPELIRTPVEKPTAAVVEPEPVRAEPTWSPPSVRLLGFAENKETSAILSFNGKTHVLSAGQSIDEVSVKEVTPPKVVLAQGDHTWTLDLFSQSSASNQRGSSYSSTRQSGYSSSSRNSTPSSRPVTASTIGGPGFPGGGFVDPAGPGGPGGPSDASMFPDVPPIPGFDGMGLPGFGPVGAPPVPN